MQTKAETVLDQRKQFESKFYKNSLYPFRSYPSIIHIQSSQDFHVTDTSTVLLCTARNLHTVKFAMVNAKFLEITWSIPNSQTHLLHIYQLQPTAGLIALMFETSLTTNEEETCPIMHIHNFNKKIISTVV